MIEITNSIQIVNAIKRWAATNSPLTFEIPNPDEKPVTISSSSSNIRGRMPGSSNDPVSNEKTTFRIRKPTKPKVKTEEGVKEPPKPLGRVPSSTRLKPLSNPPMPSNLIPDNPSKVST